MRKNYEIMFGAAELARIADVLCSVMATLATGDTKSEGVRYEPCADGHKRYRAYKGKPDLCYPQRVISARVRAALPGKQWHGMSRNILGSLLAEMQLAGDVERVRTMQGDHWRLTVRYGLVEDSLKLRQIEVGILGVDSVQAFDDNEVMSNTCSIDDADDPAPAPVEPPIEEPLGAVCGYHGYDNPEDLDPFDDGVAWSADRGWFRTSSNTGGPLEAILEAQKRRDAGRAA